MALAVVPGHIIHALVVAVAVVGQTLVETAHFLVSSSGAVYLAIAHRRLGDAHPATTVELNCCVAAEICNPSELMRGEPVGCNRYFTWKAESYYKNKNQGCYKHKHRINIAMFMFVTTLVFIFIEKRLLLRTKWQKEI